MSDPRVRLPFYIEGLPGCRGTMLVPPDLMDCLRIGNYRFAKAGPITQSYYLNSDDPTPATFDTYYAYLVGYGRSGCTGITTLWFQSPQAVKAFRYLLQRNSKRYAKRNRQRPRVRYSLHDR